MCVCVYVCVAVGLEAPIRKPKLQILYQISPKTDTLSQKLFLPTFLGLHEGFPTSAAGEWCMPYCILTRLTAFLRETVCVCVCVCVSVARCCGSQVVFHSQFHKGEL